MKTIVTKTYQCEICQREYETPEEAAACEGYPAPALKRGDVVLWTGRRDDIYGHTQSLIVDRVKRVEETRRHGPGHPVTYVLEKDYAFDDYAVHNALHGYVNCVGRPAASILHSDQIHSALYDAGERDLRVIFEALARTGIHYNPDAGANLVELYRLEYSSTWSSMSGGHRLYALRPDVLPALLQVSREPTDAECLDFIGGHQASKEKSLRGAFDYNTFSRWGAIVKYDFQTAFDWLHTRSIEELIAEVRAYRQRALDGEACLSGTGWKKLFPYRHLDGSWPKNALDFVKKHGIKGAGETRSRRVHDALTNAAITPMETVTVKNLAIFPNKKAIAVLAGKGGVGKSTVTANLARALQAAGKKVLVFDADFYGPSQPIFFPVENPRLRTKNGKILPHVVDGIEVISFGHLMEKDEALEWRGVYLQAAMHALATNIKSDADVVIFDMPPGTGDILLGLEQMCPQVGFMFVATAGEVALADVRRAINTLDGGARSRIIGVVENMAYLEGPNGKQQLWGGENDVLDAANEYHLRFLGKLPMGRDSEARLKAVDAVLTPSALDFINGKRYQKVSPKVVAAEGDATIAEIEDRVRSTKGMRMVVDIQNLASRFEANIRNLGGDPNHASYRPVLKLLMEKALQSEVIVAAIDDHFFAQTQIPGKAWWLPYAKKHHPKIFQPKTPEPA